MTFEESLRSKFEAKLVSSILRAKEMNNVPIIPNHYFTPSLIETRDMFISGYFMGAISLSQAVAEALSRFLCERNNFLRYLKKVHLERVNLILSENIITPASKIAFTNIDIRRNDFHHMNKNVETDPSELEIRAKLNVDSLSQIEKAIFGGRFSNGKFVPKNPQYWDINSDNTTEVFLDFSNR